MRRDNRTRPHTRCALDLQLIELFRFLLGLRPCELGRRPIEHADRTEWLNVIGLYSPFHDNFGYYADPVDRNTATLPKGWKSRLVNLPDGDTEGVRGLCLDPHDLAIAKYVARREKDIVFTRELAKRGIVSRDRLLALPDQTRVSEEARGRIHTHIDKDFDFMVGLLGEGAQVP
jgi:hypothetical protein